ncbi:hypothetical protein H6F98_25925 [Microcoleus sp. FACHB-SPT15]|uniref:hypothetical protein n=1 Tax=Microcoleus sp. FACHB-SPT15 TaxID=2692830 RepID=UPI00177F605B|nr:hypothetical protein [Microcoleus sp. FACHB-SPT15]MBD1808867.1 hypothetical protein [Microcoleus sp. FACHB-SPT15]
MTVANLVIRVGTTMPYIPSQVSLETTVQKVAYEQALHDFALTDLFTHLQNCFSSEFDSQHITKPESEMIAALLVQQLAKNLDSHLVAAYLKAIRQGKEEVVPEPIAMEYPESTDLPAKFPTATPIPRFIYGDRLRLCPVSIDGEVETDTDTGRYIGHYYAYAPHHCHWMWKYVIWLDKDSVSASWCVATIAWEDELEAVTQEESIS